MSASQNWMLAAGLPLALAVCLFLPWSDYPTTIFVLDIIVKYSVAILLILPIIYPLIWFNFSGSTDVEPDVYALRVTSAIVLACSLVYATVYVIGRTVLITILVVLICVQLQAKCWGVSIAATLQDRDALSFLPAELQILLRGSLLDLSDKLMAPPPRPYDVGALLGVLSLIRALVPVLLLGPESREDALRLLPPGVVERLRKPLIDHLPPNIRLAVAEPWGEANQLMQHHGPGVGEEAAVATVSPVVLGEAARVSDAELHCAAGPADAPLSSAVKEDELMSPSPIDSTSIIDDDTRLPIGTGWAVLSPMIRVARAAERQPETLMLKVVVRRLVRWIKETTVGRAVTWLVMLPFHAIAHINPWATASTA